MGIISSSISPKPRFLTIPCMLRVQWLCVVMFSRRLAVHVATRYLSPSRAVFLQSRLSNANTCTCNLFECHVVTCYVNSSMLIFWSVMLVLRKINWLLKCHNLKQSITDTSQWLASSLVIQIMSSCSVWVCWWCAVVVVRSEWYFPFHGIIFFNALRMFYSELCS